MDPVQLASQKPAYQDLRCFQNRIHLGSALQSKGACVLRVVITRDTNKNNIV